MRTQSLFSIMGYSFVFCLLTALGCAAPSVQVTARPLAKANCELYENIPIKQIGTWIETSIPVSRGAIVAVMAKGEIWHAYANVRWQPYQLLKFKVGKDGPAHHVSKGLHPRIIKNMNAVKSTTEGFLYFSIYGVQRQAYNMRIDVTLTVIVWGPQHQDHIKEDIEELRQLSPGDYQLRFLTSTIASVLTMTGDYTRSEEMLGGRNSFLRAINELRLGRYEEAKACASRPRRWFRMRGNQRGEAAALVLMAQTVSALGQYDESIKLSEEALEIGKKVGARGIMGASHVSLGYNYLRKDQLDAAYSHLKEALNYFKRSGFIYPRPECYLYLGEVQTKLNKQKEAKESFAAAIKEADALAKPEPIWVAHSRLGRIAENEGDRQKAFEHYAEAIKTIEGLRGKLIDPGLKATFMANKIYVYEWMIHLLNSMKRDPEALNYLERAKARVMLDMLAEKVLHSKVPEENALLTVERELRKQIDRISMDFLTVPADNRGRPDEQRIAELRRLQQEHGNVLDRIEKLNPELASLVSINPLKASEVQALLDPDTALLEYFLGEQARLVFVVTEKKVLAVPLEESPERLFSMIQRFRAEAVEGISQSRSGLEDCHKTLTALYEILIHPVEEEIAHVKHLVIVPHGMLHYLPFQALRSTVEGKHRYLIESYAVSYLPSASVLKYARTKNRENRKNIFAVGNPTTDLAPLPAAEKEVREISDLFKDKLVFTRERATETVVKGQSPKYDIVLFSTHGEMINDDPLSSNLRFVPSTDNDGKLTVDEIFDMDIKANLVTLSACETALARGEGGGFPQGDDLVGLSRAFIHAGAPSTVASLWKVADESTVKLMQVFHRNLRGMSKAEALRQAQLELMGWSVPYSAQRGMIITKLAGYKSGTAIECSHPFFWAPFILVGDWR